MFYTERKFALKFFCFNKFLFCHQERIGYQVDVKKKVKTCISGLQLLIMLLNLPQMQRKIQGSLKGRLEDCIFCFTVVAVMLLINFCGSSARQ